MITRERSAQGIHRAMVETPFGRFALEASAKGLRSITPLDVRPATAIAHEERGRIEREGEASIGSGGQKSESGAPHRQLPGDGASSTLRAAAAALSAYCAGDPSPYAGALDVEGTDFQLRVWRRLLAIPFGAQVTYGAIATELGGPYDARAVGAAVGANPVTILIPCHRVVGAKGKLTGYAWGLDMKRRLLAHELRIT